MRTEAWRSEPANYLPPGSQAEPRWVWPRYADLDALRHLNNVALQAMHLEARTQWQREHLGEDSLFSDALLLRPLQVHTDFVQQSHYPKPLQLAVRLVGLDNNSWTLATGLFQHQRCVGLQQTRMAAWQDGRQVALPPAVSAVLHSLRPSLDDPRLAGTESQAEAGAGLPADALQLSSYPVQNRLAARLTDQDADDVIGELALARYAEQGRAQLLLGLMASLDRREVGMMAAGIRMHCLRHGHGPDEWTVGLGISRLGRSSINVRVALFDGSTCHAVSDNAMVIVHPAAGRPLAMPDSLRRSLQALATSDCSG